MKITLILPENEKDINGSNLSALVWSSEDVFHLRKSYKVLGSLVGPLRTNHSSSLQKGLPMLLNSAQYLVLCAIGVFDPPKIDMKVDSIVLRRAIVLKDLLSQNYYVSPAAPNFGGDFLIYENDPFVVHASAVVHVTTPEAPNLVKDWIASMRLCTNTKKKWIMASVAEDFSSLSLTDALGRLQTRVSIQYCTMSWTGMSK